MALRYKREITGFLGNVTGTFQALNATGESGGAPLHYLRSSALLSPEALAFYPNRLTTNRSNPYMSPGAGLDVAAGGLKSFPVDACPGATRVIANLDPTTPVNPIFLTRFYPNLVGADQLAAAQDLFDRIRKYSFASAASFPTGVLSSALTDAPACTNQGPQPTVGEPPVADPFANYLHVYSGP